MLSWWPWIQWCFYLFAFFFQSSLVKFNDQRPESQRNSELFFAVFEWRDPYIQEIKLVGPQKIYSSSLKTNKTLTTCLCDWSFHSQQLVTANTWSSIAILCGVFMALFKAANFAKLTIQWIIRMRKRYLRNKAKEMTPVTDNWAKVTVSQRNDKHFIKEFCFVILSQNYMYHHKDVVSLTFWVNISGKLFHF